MADTFDNVGYRYRTVAQLKAWVAAIPATADALMIAVPETTPPWPLIRNRTRGQRGEFFFEPLGQIDWVAGGFVRF